MKKYFLVLIVVLIMPMKAYALSTPNMIVNHEDIGLVSTYLDDVNVRNALSNQKWLFTHASVGANMRNGMTALKNSDSRYALGINTVANVSSAVTTSGGNIYDIDRGNPGIQGKLDIFESAFDTYGWSNKINIAMNKYCYIDIDGLNGSGVKVTDIPAYANQYINSMMTLESSNPGVTFVYMTVPTLGYQTYGLALIYAFNQAVRNFASAQGKYLLDIADIESHDPSGVHRAGTNGGEPMEMVTADYTSDSAHPNTALGEERVALGWYAMAIAIAYNKNQVYVPPTLVTGITVNTKTMDLNVGESKTVTATVSPAGATNKSITWTSSDSSIATVNNGVVKAIKVGTATITVNTVDGNKKDTVVVTVKPIDVTSIVIKNKDVTKLEAGQTLKLETTISPNNATNKEVIWTSSDSNIATVDNTGLVTSLSKGTVTITVTTKDKAKTDKIDIEITPKPIPLTNINIEKIESTSLNIGDEIQLNPVLEPRDATNVQYIWESSDTSIAMISQDGLVSSIKTGAVTITLKTEDGKFLDSIELNIVKKEAPLNNEEGKKRSLIPILTVGGMVVLIAILIIIIRRQQ